MANLSTKIKIWCANNGVANVDFMKDVMLQDDSDGKGAYIKEWNLAIAKPSDAQLAEANRRWTQEESRGSCPSCTISGGKKKSRRKKKKSRKRRKKRKSRKKR